MARLVLAVLLLLGLASPAGAQSLITKTFTEPGSLLILQTPAGLSTATVQASGGATLSGSFEVTTDGIHWISPPGAQTVSISGDGSWVVPITGYAQFRVDIVSITGTESIAIAATQGVSVVTTIPASGTASPPYKVTPVNLDATSLSGSAATTVLSAGHAAAGATVTASVAYCINFNGTAGSTNGTPAGTQCGGLNTGFSAGQTYSVPPTANAVSMYGLTAGTASGTGAQ